MDSLVNNKGIHYRQPEERNGDQLGPDPGEVGSYSLELVWIDVCPWFFGFLSARSVSDAEEDFGITKPEVENFYFYLIFGLIIGARLGYVLFYDLKTYLNNPLEILAVWHGGMSFHGGLIGLLLVALLFSWKNKKSFWKIADLFIVTAPIGLGLGRIGNFINGELYGRAAQVPWAVIFPKGGPVPRHPSQLYESALEGGVLFFILWFMKDKNLPSGSAFGHFSFPLRGISVFFRVLQGTGCPTRICSRPVHNGPGSFRLYDRRGYFSVLLFAKEKLMIS